MMSETKCIYCGKGESDGIKINESDIIPDGLTNAKIKFKNVCSIEHNSNFSDMFESKIINELSFLRNHLNIKTKDKNIPKYSASFIIKDKTYPVKKIIGASSIAKKIMSTKDKTSYIGPLVEIKKFKNLDKTKLEIIDLNNIEITENIEFKTSLFISNEMYRLVSKIAYEWFCKVNEINGNLPIFKRIVEFITTGYSSKIDELIEPLSNELQYKFINETYDIGSHFLYLYVNKNKISVIVSIFGIAIYKVNICTLEDFKKFKLKEHSCSQQFLLTGEKIFVSHKDVQNLISDLQKSFEFFSLPNGSKVCIAPKSTKKVFEFLSLNEIFKTVDNEFNQESFLNILIKNYKNLISTSVLNIQSLKRFVNEYNLDLGVNLNPRGTGSEFWFNLYVIFKIGEKNIINLDDRLLILFVKNLFNSNTSKIIGNENLTKELKKEILKVENYEDFIILGAKKIKSL